MNPETVKVSVVIKALNEEAHIADAIRSALAALRNVDGEVILADSVSSDRTVEIAREFPIGIVQLARPEERCCGIGPQLGYQHSRGEFVYILDGDMELEPDFIEAALAAMEADPALGGVAGLVAQEAEASYQFRGRKRRDNEARPGDVPWLDMGGLYRRSAIEDAGYLSDRNLHAFEELELGLRLSSRGWKLRRLDVPGVRHHGYDLGSLALLRRRWQSGYLAGAGEVLRASLGRPYLWRALATQKYLLIGLALWVAFALALVMLPWSVLPLLAVGVALLALVAIRAWRSRSLRDAILGQVVWQVHAIALVRGFLAAPVDPCARIQSQVLANGARCGVAAALAESRGMS